MTRVLYLCLPAVLCCASTARIEGPDAVLLAYIAAVRTGDAERVHSLLDDATQTTVTAARVRELMTENRQELSEQVGVLESALQVGLESRAEVPLASDERVVLHIEESRWAIGGGILNAPALQTPEDAVLALRHALKRRSLEGILRVLARGPRAELEADFEQFLSDTEDVLGLDAEIQGNAAYVRTSSGRVVRLVREAGEWRVVDVE